MKVAVAERTGPRRQLGRDVVQLGPQLRLVAVLEGFAAQALEVVLDEVVQLPGELRLVEGEAAGDGLALVCERGGSLYVGDERDGLLKIRIALVLGGRLEDASELSVAKVLLDDDAVQRVNVENLRDGELGLREEARDVHEGVNLWVEWLGVDRGHGLRVLPGDAEVFARRGVGRERQNPFGVAPQARDVVRQTLARGGAEGVRGDLRRVMHRAKRSGRSERRRSRRRVGGRAPTRP